MVPSVSLVVLLTLLLAGIGHRGGGVVHLSVLGGEVDGRMRLGLRRAEVFAVFEQALGSALHAQDEFGDGGVGDGGEGVADAAQAEVARRPRRLASLERIAEILPPSSRVSPCTMRSWPSGKTSTTG